MQINIFNLHNITWDKVEHPHFIDKRGSGTCPCLHSRELGSESRPLTQSEPAECLRCAAVTKLTSYRWRMRVWKGSRKRDVLYRLKPITMGGGIQNSFVRRQISSWSFRETLLYCQGCVWMLSCFSHIQLFATPRTVTLCLWDSSGRDSRVGCQFLLQRIFLTQGSNQRLLHCRRILYRWAPREGSVQFSSVTRSCPTLRHHGLQHARPPCPSSNSRSLLKLMSIVSVMSSNHLILCRPLLLLPSIFPSFRVFSKESVLCIRWPKYWSFSFSISPSHEYSGLISFRMDWLDLLAVQGTFKSFLQDHSSKASILRHSAFSHPYTTTGKTIALTRQTFVGKVISLLFNMLSRLVTAFLPRSKYLLISWVQSPSAVILEPRKI